MADGIVDLLKAIQIELKYRQLCARAIGDGDLLMQSVVKLRAIGEARQFVKTRQRGQAPLSAFALYAVADGTPQ